MFGNYSSVVTWMSMDTAKLLVAGRGSPVRHRSPVLRPVSRPAPHAEQRTNNGLWSVRGLIL